MYLPKVWRQWWRSRFVPERQYRSVSEYRKQYWGVQYLVLPQRWVPRPIPDGDRSLWLPFLLPTQRSGSAASPSGPRLPPRETLPGRRTHAAGWEEPNSGELDSFLTVVASSVSVTVSCRRCADVLSPLKKTRHVGNQTLATVPLPPACFCLRAMGSDRKPVPAKVT